MSQPSEETRERIIAQMTEAGGRWRVRGALNPILWLCGLVAIPCIAAISWSSNPPQIISHILYAVVGVALFAFLYLLIFDRDRLHSEEYLIRSRTLDLIEEKGSRKAIDAATVRAISQTEFLELPENGDEGQK